MSNELVTDLLSMYRAIEFVQVFLFEVASGEKDLGKAASMFKRC